MSEIEDLKSGQTGRIDKEYTLKLSPNENGMAITVSPKLSEFGVSDLMIQAAGMATLDDYDLLAILLPKKPYLRLNIKFISDQELNPAEISELLRRLADGIEN